MSFSEQRLRDALNLLGAYLEDVDERLEVVAIGGSALMLLGIIDRPTQDLDLIAQLHADELKKLNELPSPIESIRLAIAEQFGFDPDWINVGPSSVMDLGLPPGFADRLIREEFGGLTLLLAGRFDQICLKLHAAADRGDPVGKHAHDLRRLDPEPIELIEAARWTQTHDPSIGFRSVLIAVLGDFGVDDADEKLLPGS